MSIGDLAWEKREILAEILRRNLEETDTACLMLAVLSGWFPEDIESAYKDISAGNGGQKMRNIMAEIEGTFQTFAREVASVKMAEERYRAEAATERDAR